MKAPHDYEDMTAHGLAILIVFGFFSVVMIALLGFVDLHDASTSSFVGLVLGNISGVVATVLGRYYRKDAITFKDSTVTHSKPDTAQSTVNTTTPTKKDTPD